MKIVFIGAGRLATHLSHALREAGHEIVQVYSRTIESATAMATAVGASSTTDISALDSSADAYIMALPDAVMPQLLPLVCKGREQKVFIHTAGSVPMDVFRGMASHYGVLYPMQTFTKGRTVNFGEIPCFIEASDELAMSIITSLAKSASNRVQYLPSADRKHLHLAAVFACNFVNHCYTVAADILADHGIPFDVMLPLIDETARKVHQIEPSEAQTGPAVRLDENVIRYQSAMLKDTPLVKDIYERMSMSIHQKSKKA